MGGGHRRHGRRRRDRQDPGGQLAGMHVRVEHRHELRQVGEELVAEDGRVRWRACPCWMSGASSTTRTSALDLDRPLDDLDRHQVQAERVRERDRLLDVVERDDEPEVAAEDLRRRSCVGHAVLVHAAPRRSPTTCRPRSAARRRRPRTRPRRPRRPAGSRRGRTRSRRRARTEAPSRSAISPSTSGTLACSRPSLERVLVVQRRGRGTCRRSGRRPARAVSTPTSSSSIVVRLTAAPRRARRRSSSRRCGAPRSVWSSRRRRCGA